MSSVSFIPSFKEFISEAAFSESKADKARILIIRILQRKIGKPLYAFDRKEPLEFISKGKRKIGYVYGIGNTLKQIRFNWSKEYGEEMESIDIWDDVSDPSKPTIHVDLKGLNVVQILDIVAQLIKNPRPGNYDYVTEARKMGQEKIDYMQLKNITSWDPSFQSDFLKWQYQNKKTKTIEAVKGVTEITIDKESDKIERKVAEKLKPDEQFRDLEELATLVAKGLQNSLLVTGTAGVGKTTVIENTLNKHGLRDGHGYEKFSGKASPVGVYYILFKNRFDDDLILFDDIDSVFANEDTKNLLKAALDSKKTRVLSWFSKYTVNKDPDEITDEELEAGILPSKFEFKGRVIFISNVPSSKIEPAILSRSMVIDINLNANEIIERMRSLVDVIEPSMKREEKLEVIDALALDYKGTKHLNVRTLLHALSWKKGGSPRWKELATRYA